MIWVSCSVPEEPERAWNEWFPLNAGQDSGLSADAELGLRGALRSGNSAARANLEVAENTGERLLARGCPLSPTQCASWEVLFDCLRAL